MNGRWRFISALTVALLLMAGCAPQARELDGIVLARVLGADGGDGAALTAVWAESSGGGVRRAEGASFAEARGALPWDGERELALTSLSYLIIGNSTAPGAVLMHVLEDREISLAAAVWAAEDAGALLEQAENSAERLDVLEAAGVEAPTAAQVLAQLWHDGAARVPVLRCRDGVLEPAGYTEWRRTG